MVRCSDKGARTAQSRTTRPEVEVAVVNVTAGGKSNRSGFGFGHDVVLGQGDVLDRAAAMERARRTVGGVEDDPTSIAIEANGAGLWVQQFVRQAGDLGARRSSRTVCCLKSAQGPSSSRLDVMVNSAVVLTVVGRSGQR